MATKTIDEILASVSTRNPDITLGTEINTSAEMYYNTSSSCSYSYSDSTLQQSNASVPAPTAPSFPTGASHPGVKKDQEKPKKNIPRKISLEDYYTQIRASVNEIKRGKRTDRMTAYLSIKEDNDKKYSIFLRSSLTTATDETYRSLRKKDNRPLIEALMEIQSNCPKDAKFFSGRLRYNPRRFKIEDDHKYNLNTAVMGVYDFGTRMTLVLFMLNEYYVIGLDDDLTTKQEGTFDFTGLFQTETPEEE
jgi:hypothetical protein